MFARILLAVAATLAVCGAAQAQFQPKPAGSFRITGSQQAPWADAVRGGPSAESRELQGATVAFAPNKVSGPGSLACAKPHYEIKTFDPEGLFQGNLPSPAGDAAALGYKSNAIPTIETGCWIDFHFIDPDHALFALNNRIYRMERVER